MTKIVRMSPQKERERFGFALKAAIDRGDRTANEIAEFTGLTEGAIDEWRAGRKLPHEGTFLALLGFMGAAFVTDLLGPFGIVAVDVDDLGVAETDPRRVQTLLAETTAEVCRSSESGRIDHQGRHRIWRVAVSLVPALMAYAPREPVSDAGHGGSDARADMRVVAGRRFER